VYCRRGDGAAALQAAVRAHNLAVVVRDPKAQAQTAATVAQAHLLLGDAPAAIEWIDDSLTIARATYPYLEAEALILLATARHRTGNPTAAANAANEAAAIARAHGYHLLEAGAVAVKAVLEDGGGLRSGGGGAE